jgi:riboflavin synthase
MFTGLIEELGEIINVKPNKSGLLITVKALKVMGDLKIDDSISVNGACQTVIWRENDHFSVQAIKETIDKTNFSMMSVGDHVNLERAMMANARLGGHIVQGHVNATAELVAKEIRGENQLYGFKIDPHHLQYCHLEGSICLNGVSLTISNISNDIIYVSLIPHTLEITNLKNLKINDRVNLEVDMVAKYLHQYFINWQSSQKENA